MRRAIVHRRAAAVGPKAGFTLPEAEDTMNSRPHPPTSLDAIEFENHRLRRGARGAQVASRRLGQGEATLSRVLGADAAQALAARPRARRADDYAGSSTCRRRCASARAVRAISTGRKRACWNLAARGRAHDGARYAAPRPSRRPPRLRPQGPARTRGAETRGRRLGLTSPKARSPRPRTHATTAGR